jgi:hypothetical protein
MKGMSESRMDGVVVARIAGTIYAMLYNELRAMADKLSLRDNVHYRRSNWVSTATTICTEHMRDSYSTIESQNWDFFFAGYCKCRWELPGPA